MPLGPFLAELIPVEFVGPIAQPVSETGPSEIGPFKLADDAVLEPFPLTLEAAVPLGSGTHTGKVDGSLAAAEVRQFTVDVESGHSLALVVTPTELLQPTISLSDPDGILLAAKTAQNAGEQVVIRAVPTTAAGTYTITLSSAAGDGDYRVELLLDATLEDEAHGGAVNDTAATAQELDGTFSQVGDWPLTRGTIAGREARRDIFRSPIDELTIGAGGFQLCIHDLRHTAASLMIQDGAPLFLLQRQLGHASILTTQRYAHLYPSQGTELSSRIDARFRAISGVGVGLEEALVVPMSR